MHPLLARQLRKSGLESHEAAPGLAAFLERVSEAYTAADDDRQMLEHSVNVASEELYERNRRLEAELEQRTKLRQRLDASTHFAEENERKYRALFELSPVGIVAVAWPGGRVLHVNDTMAALLGTSREELVAREGQALAGLVGEPGVAAGEAGSGEVPVPCELPAAQGITQFGPFERQLQRHDGTVLEVMVSGIRTPDEQGGIAAWAIVQDISERKAAERELAELARRDKLTGLANRAVFMERLAAALERVRAGQQGSYAVMFLDFDRFKLVNDTLGHQGGDELLLRISERLRAEMRAGDAMGAEGLGNVISRFGGDEFLVLINDLRTDSDALRIAERLLSALTPAYTIRGTEVHSSASIGVVTATQCLGSAEDVVRNADIAMYEAKRAGRGCVVAFNESMHERLTRHVTIENSLRRAMSSGELYLVYQPIVELGSRRLVSAEALMRWRHPTLGEVQPAEFIPIAEESRLIITLGQWLQRQACEEMVRWRLRDPDAAPASVSINVSRAEMALGARYVEYLATVLAETGLPPQCLQLELTERDVVRSSEAAQALLKPLQGLGVRLAMDDFGTGASSLGFLRGYPFHTVKIDRHFLHDLVDSRDGLAVLHAAVNLIENLGMASVAEGVENQAQLAVLQSLGCRQAQGYFLGRPMAFDALMEGARRGVYRSRPKGLARNSSAGAAP